MELHCSDRRAVRWSQLLQEGAADGHWRAFYDSDQFIPRRAMSWLIDPHRWFDWRDDHSGHFQRPHPPTGYRYWFQLFHDGTGLGCVVYYPLEAVKGDRVEVLVQGEIRNGIRRIPWIHDRGGLVGLELQDVLEEMVVRHHVTCG